MGKFMLEIELGDDEMRTPANVAAALRELALKFDEMDPGATNEEGKIIDDNGNSCGEWSFENESEDD